MGKRIARYALRSVAGGVLVIAIAAMTSNRLAAGGPIEGCVGNLDPFSCITQRPGGVIANNEEVCLENGYIVGESANCATCQDAVDEECSFSGLQLADHKHFGDDGQN